MKKKKKKVWAFISDSSNSKNFDVLPVKRSNIFLDPEHSNIFCVIMFWRDYVYLDILYGI